MRTRGPVGVLCAVLALTACGPSSADDATSGAPAIGAPATGAPAGAASSTVPSTTPSSAELPDGEAGFGSRVRLSSGLVISASSPDTFTPSENAYPPAERAVSVGIDVYNGSDRPYRLSKLSVTATVAGEEVKQVRDSARGYNGIVDADKDVPVEDSENFTLAFAVPPDDTRLTLKLYPDGSDGDTAVFTGAV
ncbi:hypothetical protein [Saccharomonospora iraqiensis]|uniref:hypothetical protein n=1 Tax=Saccharomonospora iraqiensis TaxID=52698 RepID=UPI001F45BAC5|nr:hypothetical protein [Saccharomonospora iraqiensis]